MKNKTVKNLISLGLAIAAVFVIAFVTKPKLPAPENLSAAVLLTQESARFSAQFSPVYSGGNFETAYRMTVKQKDGKVLSFVFDLTTGKVSELTFGGRKISAVAGIFKDFKANVAGGTVFVEGSLPAILGEAFSSGEATVNAVDPLKRNANTSPAAKARVNSGVGTESILK